ncbi:glycoside hydrolase family 3 N-terminal domain-containing protein [Sunxiuqinia sp. A32]|uniref:glycoside hydrolase family 3 N-terminal domain-containing protein n=1 Tax=Sunxiuqinia sp. A32 TaxID=3461496 RepID=UPI00404542E9
MTLRFFINMLLVGFVAVFYSFNKVDDSAPAVTKENKEIDRKIDVLLSQMSLEEKVGQMAQVSIELISVTDENGIAEPHQIDTSKLQKAIIDYHVGSILDAGNHCHTREHWHEIIGAIQKMVSEQTKNKIPVIYGIDAIHGTTYTEGSTLFPQQIGMAATWNPQLVEKGGEVTAYETRASGIPWDFSPVLDIGRNAVWPRFYETFGEDVYLARQMGKAIIRGYEGNNIGDKYRVASCMKHFIGYSFPLSGKDRTPAWIPENFLREYFLPTFADAVNEGAHTLMINSAEVNGTPVHANHQLLTDVLRGELDFKGFAISDWGDIKLLHSHHHIAATDKEAVKIAVNAGVDMSMIPFDFSFCNYLIELVNEGEVSEARIDEAVSRILRVKFELGLFENPVFPFNEYPKFGSEEFRLASLETAGESITLLKNEANVLPLQKSAKILVTGFAANSMRCLNGGWSYTWQGEETDKYAADKLTILEAVQAKVGDENVFYAEGVKYDSKSDENKALRLAKSGDCIVLCLGELSYTEQQGNINDLSLPDVQIEFAKKLAATGKPVILVLTEGRPRVISKFADQMNAILQAYIPGNEGGLAIADILFGDTNPSGKLPYTYPINSNDLTAYDHKHAENTANPLTSNTSYNPQYPFGHGLSYTHFSYSNLTLDQQTLAANGTLKVSVEVTNTGKVKGKEVVQLYISDLYASITPAVKRLRGFDKVELAPGEKKTVTFSVASTDLAFVNRDMKWVAEPGEFEVEISGLKQKFELK